MPNPYEAPQTIDAPRRRPWPDYLFFVAGVICYGWSAYCVLLLLESWYEPLSWKYPEISLPTALAVAVSGCATFGVGMLLWTQITKHE